MKKLFHFTLVEFFIVVALLMFLASLLVSSGNKIVKMAHLNACLNHHKQLAMANGVYQADNNEHFTLCNWRSLDFKVNAPGWLYPQKASGAWNDAMLKGSALYAYMGTIEPYRCPAEEDESKLGTNNITSYLINGVINNYGRNLVTYRTFELRTNGMILFEPSDEPFGWMWNDGSSTPNQVGNYLPARHDFQGVISSVDGSTEVIENDTYFQLLQENSPRLYPKLKD